MRSPGTTKVPVDSGMGDGGDDGEGVAGDHVGDGNKYRSRSGVEMAEYREGAEDEDLYAYGQVGNVSSHCCRGLSPTTIVYMSAFVSSLTSVLLGYDVGVISGAIKYIQADFDLNTLQTGVIVSSLNIVAAGGGLLAGSLSDALGRKRSIAAACLVFITGSLIKVAATSFWVLLLGRIVTGVGVGCGFVVAPVYIAEITPPHIRGRLTSLTDLSINLGIVIGYLVAYWVSTTVDGDRTKWKTMLGISIVPPFIILLSLYLLPESPRWLLGKGQETKAFAVLCMIVTTREMAKKELAEMKIVAGEEERGNKASWGELLCSSSPALRSTMVLGVGLGIAQQISGSEAVVYYSPSVLNDAGLTSDGEQLAGNVLVGVFKFLGEICAFVLVDRTGRRPLFISSSTLVTLFLVMLSISFSASPPAPAWVTLTGLCLFMFSFSLGMGALTFLVAAEIFPLRYRGRGVAMTVSVNRLVSGVVALSFPLLEWALTAGGTFFLFTCLSVGTVWFYYSKIPETMARTLEEISAGASKEVSEVDTATVLGFAPSAPPGTMNAI